MLHDVMPLIKTLRIDKATQMNIIVACRFVGVKALHINSLLTLRIEDEDTEDEIREIGVHFETKVRVIPFCSKFSKLEQLFFGGKTENGDDIQGFFPGGDEFWAGDEPYPDEGEREMLMALLDELSGAFRCKALPPQLKVISGLCCPESRNHTIASGMSNCGVCIRACKSFPLESVLTFECRGSSKERTKSGRSYGLDVCLERTQIDDIIEGRPGGEDLLLSKERILHLLSNGAQYSMVLDDGTTKLVIVKYSSEALTEIARVTQDAEIDMKELLSCDLVGSIMQSFITHGQMPPMGLCYLSHISFDYLKREIGLPLKEGSFYDSSIDSSNQLVDFLALIVETMLDSEAQHHADISIDCIRLIRYIIESNLCSKNIQWVLDSRVFERLVANASLDDGDNSNNNCLRKETVQLIYKTLEGSTQRQWKAVADMGVVPVCVNVFRSAPAGDDKDICMTLLHSFISRGLGKAVTKGGGVPVLVSQIKFGSVNKSYSKAAIHSMGELVRSYRSCHSLALQEGIIKSLMQKLPALTLAYVRTATAMLYELCKTMPIKEQKKMAPNLNVISELLLTADDDVLTNVCGTIQIILKVVVGNSSARMEIESYHPKLPFDTYAEIRLCKHLLKLLISDVVQALAIGNIKLLTMGDDGHLSVQTILDSDNGLASIRNLLARSSSDNEARNVCWTVHNLVNNTKTRFSPEQRVQVVLDSGIVSDILQVLVESKTPGVLKGALWALNTMIRVGTLAQVVSVVSNDMFGRPMSTLIVSDYSEIASMVLTLLRIVSIVFKHLFCLKLIHGQIFNLTSSFFI